MSEKRFVVETVAVRDEVITDTEKCYSYEDLDEIVDKLNEQQGIIEEKSNVIILMGAFIKSKGFSIDDFDEWISKDWHNVGDDL